MQHPVYCFNCLVFAKSSKAFNDSNPVPRKFRIAGDTPRICKSKKSGNRKRLQYYGSVVIWDVLIFIYLGALVLGTILSFTLRRQPHRRNIRIATGVLTTPILGLFLFGVFLWFVFGKEPEPPTLSELQRDYPQKRADLETILRMSDEDSNFWRVAPDFVDRVADEPGRYMQNDPKAGLPQSRWNEYRQIYAKNGIKLGIQRNSSHDAFIMVDSVGLLNRGHASGYVYCAPTAPANAYRFYPCMLRQDKGERKYKAEPREEGYKFQRIADRWYAYDEGPS